MKIIKYALIGMIVSFLMVRFLANLDRPRISSTHDSINFANPLDDSMTPLATTISTIICGCTGAIVNAIDNTKKK